MKKLLFICLFLIFIGLIFSQDAIKLNKGEISPFNGILINEEDLQNLVNDSKNIKFKDELIKEQQNEIETLKNLVKEKDIQIEQWTFKYNSEVVLRIEIDKQLSRQKQYTGILWTTNGVGWGFAFGELGALIFILATQNYLK